jgi:hypothetical protein
MYLLTSRKTTHPTFQRYLHTKSCQLSGASLKTVSRNEGALYPGTNRSPNSLRKLSYVVSGFVIHRPVEIFLSVSRKSNLGNSLLTVFHTPLVMTPLGLFSGSIKSTVALLVHVILTLYQMHISYIWQSLPSCVKSDA